MAKLILVKYERNKMITDFFSSICANRVIWGGDNTITEIRKSPLPARSFDITFSDRYSLCILEIDAVLRLSLSEMNRLAVNFYNDTYLFDQNACTSPHTIIWTGNHEKLSEAQNRFWSAVRSILEVKKYTLEAASVVDKLTYAYEHIMNGNVDSLITSGNLIYRAHINYINQEVFESHSNSGYFNELYLSDLQMLSEFLDSPKIQTISYFGVNSEYLGELTLKNGLKGVDRIVSIGKTADFSSNWDGIDFIRTISRKINFQ
jgi:hypothetical protein